MIKLLVAAKIQRHHVYTFQNVFPLSFFLFEIEYHVADIGPQLPTEPRMTLNICDPPASVS